MVLQQRGQLQLLVVAESGNRIIIITTAITISFIIIISSFCVQWSTVEFIEGEVEEQEYLICCCRERERYCIIYWYTDIPIYTDNILIYSDILMKLLFMQEIGQMAEFVANPTVSYGALAEDLPDCRKDEDSRYAMRREGCTFWSFCKLTKFIIFIIFSKHSLLLDLIFKTMNEFRSSS